MKAHIIKRLSFADYCAIDAVNFSTLKHIEVSPKHYAHAIRTRRPDSPALIFGRVLHEMILDPTPPKVAIYEGKVRNGKAWDAFEAEHVGETILKRSEIEDAAAMRAALLADPVAGPLLVEGDGEVTLRFSMLDHACKGRVDWLLPNGAPCELKTTKNISERAFTRDAVNYKYAAQQAFYWGGLTAALGREPPELPRMITVEKTPPYDVAVYRIGYDTIEAGQRMIDAWIKDLDTARRSKSWPGIARGRELDFRLPEWALTRGLEDVDLSGIEEGGTDDGR